jgi:hypothetical protein
MGHSANGFSLAKPWPNRGEGWWGRRQRALRLGEDAIWRVWGGRAHHRELSTAVALGR